MKKTVQFVKQFSSQFVSVSSKRVSSVSKFDFVAAPAFAPVAGFAGFDGHSWDDDCRHTIK